ncbi:MAG: Jag N-terminal domain-containing protein [Campylobacterota bacterium]|nr:Jag N-terminal domain-containing protein [Campylobacterota bacterium]
MIRIESVTLEEAYKDAASSLKCSVTELKIEVVQYPSSGFLGLFKKSAVIVAVKEVNPKSSNKEEKATDLSERKVFPKKKEKIEEKSKQSQKKDSKQTILNDTIMPESFVSDQDDEDDDLASGLDYTADYDEDEEDATAISEVAKIVKEKINSLFAHACFNIDEIAVTVYDENMLLVEFKGDDAALLIGKEGYRYKALSYMIFNWINITYQVQLRLEIAEFLQNQEESISRYLVNVCENIDRDGRAQTKILDGVLVQIALKELRDKYPDKYVAIRSTRDGLKYIIINDYHT